MWTHLERQRGGIGMRGPGETQIETDRRIILSKISLLKEELRAIDKQKSVQRKNRGKLTRVALVAPPPLNPELLQKARRAAQGIEAGVREFVPLNLPVWDALCPDWRRRLASNS